MKPTYTVRLTGPLDPAERMRVAQRVAGTTDIDADKIARLLERGEGRDLIKPSSANVANRLASVLAEAGAPVQLVPIAGDAADASAARGGGAAPGDEQPDAGLRPRQAGAEARGAVEGVDPAGAGARAARPDVHEDVHEDAREDAREDVREDAADAGDVGRAAASEHVGMGGAGARAARPADAEPAGAEVPGIEPVGGDGASRIPERQKVAPDESRDLEGDAEVVVGREETAPPPVADEPVPSAAPPPEPAVPEAEPPTDQGAARTGPRRGPQPITRPQRSRLARNGTAFLGAVGAAVLGIGAVLAMDFLLGPIAIGVLVLAALALLLSLAGQRRTIWLPGAGSIALLVWALLNAEGGALASLAGNWTWFAMFAGALLLIVAGLQESQRRRPA